MENMMATTNKIFNLHVFSSILIASLVAVLGQQNSSNIRCLERERQALLKFKDELVDEHGRLSSWGSENSQRECCKWRGVRCHNRTNHVTQVEFEGIAPLEGKISSSLLELKHLTYLDLSHNYFGSSNIPEFIGSFEELLYLNLSNAHFSKSIPPSLGNLSKLIYLDFSQNYDLYSDNLDWVSHLDSLKYLDLSYVVLRNASNWLEAIGKLTTIEELHFRYCVLQEIHLSSLPLINSSAPLAILDLSGNDISSSMFQWFLNFSKSLTFIDISGNNITDPISAYTFDDQIFLAHLDLSYNNHEGGIPKSLGNMSSLIYLNLQRNHLTAQLSELTMNLSEKLQYLDLSGNRISGLLPNFSRFSFLNHLGLGRNKLDGSIANGFLNIPYLIHLDLSSNNFTGAIPDLTTSPFLKRLYLNNNTFNGYLRESIGCMSMMESLVLASNNLEGIVTESHLFNLSCLQILDLSSNSLLTVNCSPHWVPPFQLKVINLSGCKIGQRFPQWLQFQRKLEFLDISSSQIADTVPHWFGKLTSRPMYLNASNNNIHGILPESFFKLTRSVGTIVLELSRNKIRGQVTFLCHNENVGLLILSDNLFFGHLPNCVANSTLLRFLNLANNHFVGEIPNSFGSLESLVSLNLRNNSLSGGFPTSVRNCKRLESIELGDNKLTGNIPTWIGDTLSGLIVLSLNLNDLYGTIPSSMCSLQNIQVLDLSSNIISGPIPKCLYNLSAMTREAAAASTSYGYRISFSTRNNFVYVPYNSLRDGAYIMWKGKKVEYVKGLQLMKLIDLSNNLLDGDIPSEITKLDGLVTLNLSRNHLYGQIPQNIGHLKGLNSLDLSRNHLSGSIPIGIFELSSLGVLDLSYNNLSGRILPQYTRFDKSAYAGNSGLCARLILNKSCPGEDEINHRDPNFYNDKNAMNNWEHEDDKLITKGFYLCLAFGFLIGFWGIFGTILLNNSARFAYFKLLNTMEDFVYVTVELSKARFRSRFRN
ncbi:LOW QUALITY PROTEIN: receptor-like protein EIX2 [Primulina eburnea]|uniref:LOW QUALITY PROTEIN: receptor-like protein EIX2 n=1 Tax=Primulina eburnea TaxID=1245227 RepID=UPI003C6BF2CB